MPPPVRRPGEVETSHAMEAGAGSTVAWIMVGIGGLQLLHNIFGHEKVVYEHHVRRVGRSRRRRARARRNPPRGDTLLAVSALALGYFLLPPRTPPTSIPSPRPVPPEEAPSVIAQRPDWQVESPSWSPLVIAQRPPSTPVLHEVTPVLTPHAPLVTLPSPALPTVTPVNPPAPAPAPDFSYAGPSTFYDTTGGGAWSAP